MTAILNNVAPYLEQVPLLREIDWSETRNVNALIVNTTEQSRQIVDEVRQALITVDVSGLKKYREGLEKVNISLRQALAQSTQHLQPIISDSRATAAMFQTRALELTEALSILQSTVLQYAEIVNGTASLVTPHFLKVPLLGPKLDEMGFQKIQTLSGEIADLLQESEQVTTELEWALKIGDMGTITVCLGKLTTLYSSLETLFSSPERDETSGPLP